MNQIRQAAIRQIKHSAVLVLCSVVFALAFLFLFCSEPEYAFRLFIILLPGIIFISLYLIGFLTKGLLAAIDMINLKTAHVHTKIIGVVIEGYVGANNRHVIGRVYSDTKATNKKWKRCLPFSDCFAFSHDISLLGMPNYLLDHTYNLTYLRCSKIIVSIEDVSKKSTINPIPCNISQYAQSILDKKQE